MFKMKLGKENDFAKCAISSVLTDNAIESVINVKFIETLYGNPLKNDISLNDVLFLILESVIGLDTIIMSFYDRNIITLRVNEIMKNKKGDFEGFNVIINNIYNGLSDCQSYDEIITGLSDYKDELADYIQGGLDMQLYEIMNNPQGSYDNYNMLFARINDLIPKINAKKM